MNAIITSAARALTICIAATLGFSAADASASNLSTDRSVPGAPPTYVVRFADLDLAKIEGVTTLYGRLSHAAREVCDPLISTRWFPEKYHACVDKAIADAVAKVNRPLLTQYHQLRTKGDKAGLVQLAKAH
jgi:UrcA family protein